MKHIRGYLNISNNTSLTSVEGLRALTSIGWFLAIESNASLASIEGLRNLTTIGAYLKISSNADLPSVEGLRNLKYICESDDDGYAISLCANPHLERGLPFPALLCKNGKVCRDERNGAYVDSHLAALDRVPDTC